MEGELTLLLFKVNIYTRNGRCARSLSTVYVIKFTAQNPVPGQPELFQVEGNRPASQLAQV
jgi:hypothetical protein